MKACAFALFFVLLFLAPSAALAQDDLQHQLLSAVEQNETGKIKSLIAAGADVNLSVTSSSPLYMFFLSRQLYLDGLRKKMVGEPVYVSAIHANALKANRKVFKLLLKKGANLDAGDSYGKTPLMYALRTPGGEDYALELIAKGANYTAKDLAGNTAMHYAAFGGNMQGIHMTMAGGINVNTPNNEGITPILAAAVRAPISVMQGMQNLGADLLHSDKAGMNALHYAVGYGTRDKIKWLLEQAPGLLTETKAGLNPLDIAMDAGNTSVVVHLRRIGVKFNSYYYEELTAAVVAKDLEAAEVALTKSANPNRPAASFPLHIAVQNRQADMVKLLLRFDADPEVLDSALNSPLDLALQQESGDLATILLNGNAKGGARLLLQTMDRVVKGGKPAVWMPVIEALARQAPDLSVAGGDMNIPALHYAAYLGMEDVAHSLLDAGADPNLADPEGWTPLHWAVMKGDLQAQHPEKKRLAELLLDRGATLNVQATAAKLLPHKQPYLARRVPVNATPTDVIGYALPKDLMLQALLLSRGGETRLTGDDYVSNGVALLEDKDYRAAMLEFNRAIGHDPSLVDAYFYRGHCKSSLSMFQEAERDFAFVMASKPMYPEAIFARGRALFELAQYPEAIQHFEQAMRMEFKVGECLYLRGKCKLRQGQRNAACKDFEAAEAAGSTEATMARDLYCKK